MDSFEEESLLTKSLLTLAAILTLSITSSSQTKLLRFPDIRGDRVVFTYGGDLWTAPSSGGTALHLTSHPGVELFGKFSPDGQWIVFERSKTLDDNREIDLWISKINGANAHLLARNAFSPSWR